MSVVLLFHFLNVHDDVIHSVLAKVYGYSIVCILLCIHDRRIIRIFFCSSLVVTSSLVTCTRVCIILYERNENLHELVR